MCWTDEKLNFFAFQANFSKSIKWNPPDLIRLIPIFWLKTLFSLKVTSQHTKLPFYSWFFPIKIFIDSSPPNDDIIQINFNQNKIHIYNTTDEPTITLSTSDLWKTTKFTRPSIHTSQKYTQNDKTCISYDWKWFAKKFVVRQAVRKLSVYCQLRQMCTRTHNNITLIVRNTNTDSSNDWQ